MYAEPIRTFQFGSLPESCTEKYAIWIYDIRVHTHWIYTQSTVVQESVRAQITRKPPVLWYKQLLTDVECLLTGHITVQDNPRTRDSIPATLFCSMS